MTEQAEQIEADVTKRQGTPIKVPALEYWEVWYVEPDEHVWELLDAAIDKGELENYLERVVKNPNVRIVHYTLPALTIEAKEN